jgi:exonuclease SbcC
LKLKKLSLVNYCQHAEREDVFAPGITLIHGPNGSGKSNLVKSIFRLLTGISLNGVNADDIRVGTEKGHGELEFEVNGTPGVIKRFWDTSRCNLTFGDRKFKTATEVDRVIYEIIGVQPKVLSEMVFVMQGAIDGILFGKPAERAKSFQVLFNTAGLETVRDLLHEEMEKVVIVSRKELIDQLKQQLATTVEEPLRKAEDELKSVKLNVMDEKAYTKCSNLIANHENFIASMEAQKRLADAVMSIEGELGRASTEVRELTDSVLGLESSLKDVDADYRAANARIAASHMAAARKAHVAHLRSIIENAEKVLLLPEPTKPITKDELDKLRAEYDVLMHKLRSANSIVTTFNSGGGVCPTCTQTVPQFLVEQQKALLEMFGSKALDMKRKLEDSELAFARYLSDSEHLRARKEELKRARDTAAATLTQHPDMRVEATQADVELVALVNELNGSLNESRGKLAAAKANVEQLTKRLEDARTAGSDNLARSGERASDTDYKACKDSLELHNKSRDRVARLEGTVLALESQRKTILDSVEKHEKEESGLAKVREWRGLLERTRILLHRDNLPNLVARSYLGGINAAIGKYLEMFNSKFQAVIKDDLSVECHFAGGFKQPSERLSGGQRVMLGLAFRFAVYDLFTATLGVLVLDEPTVFLDDANVDRVIELLEHVKAYSRTSNLQVLVVSHESKLIPVFDHVIKVGD